MRVTNHAKHDLFHELATQLSLPSLHIEDLVALSEINDQGEMLALRLIGVFRQVAPKMLGDIEFFVLANDRVGAAKQLAVVEQASARIGAKALASICRAAIASCESRVPRDEVIARITAIRAELERVNRDLTEISKLVVGF